MGVKSPAQIAEAVSCSIGVSKCSMSVGKTFILAIFAGVYIGFGAILATTVTHDMSAYMGLGMAKFAGGAVFSVGLMLVVLCGAELFTGNNLIFTSALDKKVTFGGMARNWGLVYIGNFAGSLLLVFMYFLSGLYGMGNGGVASAAVKIATAKVNLTWTQAFFRGILCNILVCLAVWMVVSAENTIGKIFACFFPIMAFVASGFEHSIANMYFIPIGILLGGNGAVFASASTNLTWWGFIWNNLIPVTLGNIVGGAFFVSGLYWYAYRKDAEN